MFKSYITTVLIIFTATATYGAAPPSQSAQMDQVSPVSKLPKKAMSIGLELGGNGSLLVTDPTVQAFGSGAGYQGSLFFNMWNDRKIGGKFRAEMISLQEVSIQKSRTDYILANTSLKSLTQGWTVFSVGAEGHFESQRQTFFWEALLGYAMGSTACSVTITYSTPDTRLLTSSQNCNSGFAISGGVGIKKSLGEKIEGVMSVRTFFLIGPVYSSAPLSTRTIIPLPLLFSLGASYPFD